jgi:glucose/arabinose dehydrogenase
MVVTNLAAPTKTVFLDLTARTDALYQEAGLLGMAFHPQFSSNGHFYLYRTLETVTPLSLYGFHDQLSRFSIDPKNPNQALPESEQVLIAQPDASDEHNAGCVAFGPDGYLYLSLGDSANPGLVITNYVQRIDGALFGGILRIDVDKRPGNLAPAQLVGATANYAIPADNPFVGVRQFLGSPVDPANVRTEFFAVGLRNPWRMSFDQLTGRLYCGDVGEGANEEIDIIVSGGNYGWPFYEGLQPGIPPQPAALDPIAPIYEYPHDLPTFGGCVIGGVVYYGASLPALNGQYFFGDYASGKIWALKLDGSSPAAVKWIASLPQLSTFGLDPRNGDVLAASLKDGTIRRIVYVDPLSQSVPAGKLSQIGIFKDVAALTPANGLVPYDINVPFWSDFALKKRWFCLPQGSSPIKFNSTNNWEFPPGTFWVKHFDLERVRGRPETAVRMETRILVKTELDVYGLTYRWLDNQQDAELVPAEGADREFIVSESGTDRPQTWHYPSRSECSICHTKQGGYALGFNTSQLNLRLSYGGIVTNQICALASGGFLDTNRVSEATLLSPLAPAADTNAPLQYRARSFFAANCSQCHQPGAFGARWDARITIPLKDALIVNEPGIYTFGDNRIIVPGSVEKSDITRRLSAPVDTLFHMPPLASHELNNDGIDLVSAWITNMTAAPWQESDIGVPLFEGSASSQGGVLLVSGGGSGMSISTDSFHFLYQPMDGNGSIVVRLLNTEQTSSNCTAGLMLREDLSAGSGCAVLMANREGWSFSIRNPLSGDKREQFLPGVPFGSWMRLKREDGKITAGVSTDGSTWKTFGDDLELSAGLLAGLCAASMTSSPVVSAGFDSWAQTSIRLTSPGDSTGHDGAIPLALEAEVSGQTNALISYYINGQKVAESTNRSVTVPVSNLPPGSILITASVLDGTAQTIRSEPVEVQLTRVPALAVFQGEDDQTEGHWEPAYGSEGSWLPGRTASISDELDAQMNGPRLQAGAIDASPNDLRLLQDAGSGRRNPNLWMAGSWIEISLSVPLGSPVNCSLYFFNPDQDGSEEIDWYDVNSGKLLDSQTISDLGSSKYLTWTVSGSLRVRISSIGSPFTSLGGVFIDDYPVPEIELNISSEVMFSNPLSIEATAMPGPKPFAVEFLEDGQLITIADTEPFVCSLSNLRVGSHTISAYAIDAQGFRGHETSISLNMSQVPASTGEAMQSADVSSVWALLFGSEAYLIPGYRTNLSEAIDLSVLQGSTYIFDYNSPHPSALSPAQGINPIASCIYDGSRLSIDLDLTDRKMHDLTLFFSEYGPDSRIEKLQIFDADTEVLIHSATIGEFGTGYFYSLPVQGHLDIEVSKLDGGNAILNAIFVDPLLPRVAITSPQAGSRFLTLGTSEVDLAIAGPEIQSVSIFDFDQLIGGLAPGEKAFAWTNILTGDHSLSAVVSSSYGNTMSASVPVSIVRTQSSAAMDQYEAWKLLHFSEEDRHNDSRSSMFADPDGDGLNNIGEFVLNSDPLVSSSRGRIETGMADGEFLLTFSVAEQASYWHIRFESSTDLHDWKDAVDFDDQILSDNRAVQNHKIHFSPLSEVMFIRFSFVPNL